MDSERPRDDARRRLQRAIGDALRELRSQLSLLDHEVGAHLELKDVDLDCIDLLDRHGPLSPGALARLAGLHPATMTGILDRLERASWLTRERDDTDRRSVVLRPTRHRYGEMMRLYAGMNKALHEVCAPYDDDQLELLADFLRRVAAASGRAIGELRLP